ncbi:MAG TPA: NAD(P)-dependent oxidoreductase [Chthonomonadaceae bacterium]|nr:NAD(P)-dependent oxidoreductase [Chthonomonadaceae bacterium]
MNVLVIGGSGYVASLILPVLLQRHNLRIFDLQPPPLWQMDTENRDQDPSERNVEFHQGNVCDAAALASASKNMDALLYMAMGSKDWQADDITISSFDVNVKGIYLALEAAHGAGISHAVYTSSMSVYDGDLYCRHFPDEEIPSDSRHIYGFTKRLGEECCRNAARAWSMTVNALRLCHPMPEERWLRETRLGTPTIATTADDVARALLAALDYRGPGFEAFMISGDYEQKHMNMSKARRLLNWEPLARPLETPTNP